MRISYRKLKILMIDNQMKRADLIRAAELSPYAAKKIVDKYDGTLTLSCVDQIFKCDITLNL